VRLLLLCLSDSLLLLLLSCRHNAAEMYVDVETAREGQAVQWITESGVLDLFVMTGPTPVEVTQQYSVLTGTTAMPQLFSLGYHQCR
jgi:alpha 1,3-glucosidase